MRQARVERELTVGNHRQKKVGYSHLGLALVGVGERGGEWGGGGSSAGGCWCRRLQQLALWLGSARGFSIVKNTRTAVVIFFVFFFGVFFISNYIQVLHA